MNMHPTIWITALAALLFAGCSQYDASQAEQVEPLGTPPLVDLTGSSVVTRPDSLKVQAHVTPGEFEIADWNFGVSNGDIVQTRLLRVLPDRIDIEATLDFSRNGTYWIWVHVWDTEEQVDTDSLQVTVN